VNCDGLSSLTKSNNSGLTGKTNGNIGSKCQFSFVVHPEVLYCHIRDWRIFYEELCQLLTVYVPEDYIMDYLLPFVSTFTVDMLNYHITLNFPVYPGISCWNIFLFHMCNYHNFFNKKLDVRDIKVLLINEIWHIQLMLRSISLG